MAKQGIELKLLFKSPEEAKILYWGVRPDIVLQQRRSKTKFNCRGKSIELVIIAEDKNALRASFSSIMSHLSLAKKIAEIR
ncbi:MAG: KEOPS complex subunit Pcc1 [Candidatus Diapherotrites archaeon]